MRKADAAWLDLPIGFRRMLARQAGVGAEYAGEPLSNISIDDCEKLHEAARVLGVLVEAARPALVKACIRAPRPRGQSFANKLKG